LKNRLKNDGHTSRAQRSTLRDRSHVVLSSDLQIRNRQRCACRALGGGCACCDGFSPATPCAKQGRWRNGDSNRTAASGCAVAAGTTTFPPVLSGMRSSSRSRQSQPSSGEPIGASRLAQQDGCAGSGGNWQHVSSGAGASVFASILPSAKRPQPIVNAQQHTAGDQIARYIARKMRSTESAIRFEFYTERACEAVSPDPSLGRARCAHDQGTIGTAIPAHLAPPRGRPRLIPTPPDHADKTPPARCTGQGVPVASPGRARRTPRSPPRRTPPRSSRRTHPAASRGRTRRR
jgi:hypothetical protein